MEAHLEFRAMGLAVKLALKGLASAFGMLELPLERLKYLPELVFWIESSSWLQATAEACGYTWRSWVLTTGSTTVIIAYV